MAYYGRDYGTGRSNWRNRGDFGYGGYDSEYGGGFGQGWSAGRGQSWSNLDRNRGWNERGRGGGFGSLDESWRSAGPNRGRSGFEEGRWSGQSGWHGGGGNFGDTRRSQFDHYGDTDRSEFGSFSGSGRSYFDRGNQGYRQSGHDYDQDFGDRLRRGWNRFRDEAREWMGRGYDRNW